MFDGFRGAIAHGLGLVEGRDGFRLIAQGGCRSGLGWWHRGLLKSRGGGRSSRVQGCGKNGVEEDERNVPLHRHRDRLYGCAPFRDP